MGFFSVGVFVGSSCVVGRSIYAEDSSESPNHPFAGTARIGHMRQLRWPLSDAMRTNLFKQKDSRKAQPQQGTECWVVIRKKVHRKVIETCEYDDARERSQSCTHWAASDEFQRNERGGEAEMLSLRADARVPNREKTAKTSYEAHKKRRPLRKEKSP